MLTRFVKNWKFRFLIICLVWFVWFVLASIQTYLSSFDKSTAVVIHNFIDYAYVGLIWIVVTPIIIEVTKSIKINGNYKKVVGLHMLFSFVVLIIRTLPYSVVTLSHNVPEISFYDNWIEIVSIQFLGNFIIYSLIVVSYYSIVWYLDFRQSEYSLLKLNLKSEQLERSLTEATLKSLRMQINPHFLFNTLHTVASLIRVEKSNEAIVTLSNLSDLLRSTVYENNAEHITIQAEIEFLKKYLSIEELRFSDRLKINWQIEKEVMNYIVPKLLLQPIIENALKHGLKEKKQGILSIEIGNTLDKQIIFVIEDNGNGLPPNFDIIQDSGVGLKNTLERLDVIYNRQFYFDISNLDSAGVRVQIIVPNCLMV